jgi:hypothetical protein
LPPSYGGPERPGEQRESPDTRGVAHTHSTKRCRAATCAGAACRRASHRGRDPGSSTASRCSAEARTGSACARRRSVSAGRASSAADESCISRRGACGRHAEGHASPHRSNDFGSSRRPREVDVGRVRDRAREGRTFSQTCSGPSGTCGSGEARSGPPRCSGNASSSDTGSTAVRAKQRPTRLSSRSEVGPACGAEASALVTGPSHDPPDG